MGFLDFFKTRNAELEYMFDLELLEDQSNKTVLKQSAIQSVIGMIARTVIQSEFRVKESDSYVKKDMYYRLNVKPNQNQSAPVFWEQVINKLIYDGECLIIKTDTDDLLVADSYTRIEYALFGDSFKDVVIKNHEYKRTFQRNEVILFEYGNEKLSKLIDGLFGDYGELLGRLIEFQKRKNQVRATVDIDATQAKDEDTQGRVQKFIDRAYKSLTENAIALIPQQKGFKYEEHSKATTGGASVDEINKVTDGFVDQIANAVGLPVALLRGDMADVEKITRNYMTFCIDPILKVIEGELNVRFIEKADYLKGDRVNIRRVTYSNIFDIATSVDKLISSGVFNGDELRDAAGYELSGDPIHSKYWMTKNYQEGSQALEGGDKE